MSCTEKQGQPRKVVIVGAGDVDRMVTWVRQAWGGTPPVFSSQGPDWVTEVERLPFESSRCRRNEPLGLRTTMGVGGVADLRRFWTRRWRRKMTAARRADPVIQRSRRRLEGSVGFWNW